MRCFNCIDEVYMTDLGDGLYRCPVCGDEHDTRYPQSSPYDDPPKRVKPTCPKCDSIMYIKVKRCADGKLLIRCLDCEHEGMMTNAEYYGS